LQKECDFSDRDPLRGNGLRIFSRLG